MKLPQPIDVLNYLVPRFGTDATRNVAYGPDPRHRIDIYQPGRPDFGAARRPLPVVVFFYGGSWQTGSRAEYRFLGTALARLGLIVAIADYRLYPAAHYPDFIEDAAQATAFMLRNADSYGGDPRSVFLAGHSAGAYIALMLALNPAYLAAAGSDRALLAGAIGLSGPYDFLPITGPIYRKIFGTSADLIENQPIAHVDAEAPPTLLLTGARDKLVAPANTTSLAAKLRTAGASVDTRVYPSLGHIRILLSILPPLSLLVPVSHDIRDFITRTLHDHAEAAHPAPKADMAGRRHPG